jgi:hypothetical protein
MENARIRNSLASLFVLCAAIAFSGESFGFTDPDGFLGFKFNAPFPRMLPCGQEKEGRCLVADSTVDSPNGAGEAVAHVMFGPDLGFPYDTYVHLLDGKVHYVSIHTDPGYSDVLLDALTAKFGNYTTEDGVKTWKGTNVWVRMWSVSGEGRCQVLYMPLERESEARDAAMQKRKAAEAAKGM